MATKIILTIEDGLSRQEQDDLQHLLADAISEFAVRRSPATAYVNSRYPVINNIMGVTREDKVKQVERRVALATKLHGATLSYDLEHHTPHQPMPVYDYYKTCDEDDLNAMSKLLDLLPASQFGERKDWVVLRESGILIVEGPDEQRAFWHDLAERWMWLEEGETPKQETIQ